MTILLKLFNGQLYKDIDEDFVDSLEAILYLSPLNNNDLYKSDKIKLKIDHHDYFVNYTVLDILNTKLIDNFRRIYAVNNPVEEKLHVNTKLSTIHALLNAPKAKKNNKQIGLPDLLEQQKCIYKVFQLLHNNINNEVDDNIIDEMTNKKYYKKAILGKDQEVSTVEIFSYLSLHESLNENNRKIHNEVLSIYMNQYSLSYSFSNTYLSKIIRKPVTNESFDMIINNVIKNNKMSELLYSFDFNNNHSWTLGVINNLMMDHLDKLSQENKVTIIKTIIQEGLYDNKYLNSFVPDSAKLIDTINDMVVNDNLQPEVMKIISVLARPENFSAKTIPTFMKAIKQLVEPNLFIKTFLSAEVNENQKIDIYNYYDFNDQDLLKSVAKNLNQKKVFLEQMQMFVHLVANHIEKETLAYIISLDSNYMKICKPVYMNIRINEKAKEIAMSNVDIQNKKLKI